MTIVDIFEIIENALENDTALQTWCEENYGTDNLSIIFGLDEENPPELQTDLAVLIIPGARSRTRQFAYRSHGLRLQAFVKMPKPKQETSENESQSSNLQTDETEVSEIMDGLGKVDAFISLIEECVITNLNKSGVIVTPMEGESDAIKYPYSAAELSLLIEIPSRLPIN